VIGQEFRLDVLQRVAGLTEEVVFEALEEAHARAIIDESGGFGTSLRFRFTHAFFRQTLYDEIFAPRRIRDSQAYAAAGFALTHVLELAQAEAMPVHAAEFVSASHARMRIADLAHALSAAGRWLLAAGDRDAAERAWEELDRLAAQSREPTTRLQGPAEPHTSQVVPLSALCWAAAPRRSRCGHVFPASSIRTTPPRSSF
jgi:predicted ATPase